MREREIVHHCTLDWECLTAAINILSRVVFVVVVVVVVVVLFVSVAVFVLAKLLLAMSFI